MAAAGGRAGRGGEAGPGGWRWARGGLLQDSGVAEGILFSANRCFQLRLPSAPAVGGEMIKD